MKQTQVDKYTIAWFKIAECVSRGEKERALGVYRLLSHSFNDTAVSHQLEGDIYYSFGEEKLAISLYQQSMELYQKSQRFLEAVAVAEHLLSMLPDDLILRREAIKLYTLLGNMSKMKLHTQKVLDSMILMGREHSIQEFLAMIHEISDELYEYALSYTQC